MKYPFQSIVPARGYRALLVLIALTAVGTGVVYAYPPVPTDFIPASTSRRVMYSPPPTWYVDRQPLVRPYERVKVPFEHRVYPTLLDALKVSMFSSSRMIGFTGGVQIPAETASYIIQEQRDYLTYHQADYDRDRGKLQGVTVFAEDHPTLNSAYRCYRYAPGSSHNLSSRQIQLSCTFIDTRYQPPLWIKVDAFTIDRTEEADTHVLLGILATLEVTSPLQ